MTIKASSDKSTTEEFTKSTDEFGSSFCCNTCGKNQFYVKEPVQCDHQPQEYEVKMFAKKR